MSVKVRGGCRETTSIIHSVRIQRLSLVNRTGLPIKLAKTMCKTIPSKVLARKGDEAMTHGYTKTRDIMVLFGAAGSGTS